MLTPPGERRQAAARPPGGGQADAGRRDLDAGGPGTPRSDGGLIIALFGMLSVPEAELLSVLRGSNATASGS
jgi:hypothetical protein